MRVASIRISWLMALVAIAALNFAVIRPMWFNAFGAMSVIGALPMVNVLAVGLLLGQGHPRSRPFLAGFEVSGTLALAVFVVLARRCTGSLYAYLAYPMNPSLFPSQQLPAVRTTV